MKRVILTATLLFTGCGVSNYSDYGIVEDNYEVRHHYRGTSKPYEIAGVRYYPKKSVPIGWTQRGISSWYGPNFHGKLTSNGEVYNMYAMTAAHKTLPLGTIVKVKNLKNGRSVIVRINDRGPFVKGRIIDLSYAAGKKLGLNISGTAPVEIRVIGFKGKNYVKGFMIQVGAFKNRRGAEKISKYYKNLGYNTEIISLNGLNKVFISGFNSYNEAKEFRENHNLKGFIVGE